MKLIKDGIVINCGSFKDEVWMRKNELYFGLASMRVVMGSYKARAKKRRLEWKLTEEQFKELTQKDCYYCGDKPSNITKFKTHNGNYIYNGIDRINNDLGYTLDNVVPCCKHCNMAKNTFTLQEFKDWVGRVYNISYYDVI